MLTCPVCRQTQAWDVDALNVHVNSHFDGPVASTSAGSAEDIQPATSERSSLAGSKRATPEEELRGSAKRSRRSDNPSGVVDAGRECFICGLSFDELPLGQTADDHVNFCLDQGETPQLDDAESDAQLALEDGLATANDPGTLAANANQLVIKVKRVKGDVWWNQLEDPIEKLPKNYSPGVIPVLHRILSKSFEQGITKEAVLCDPGAIHIKGSWMFDLGWGCGYRNFLMALSALLTSYPGYRTVFPSVTIEEEDVAPGVHQLQKWIEDGWNKGFDVMGAAQLNGKIVGTRKWIGTSDLYAVFTAKSIPCTLYDFPKPTGAQWHSTTSTHTELLAWIKRYFNEQTSPLAEAQPEDANVLRSAFDALKQSKGRASERLIRVTTRMPLILQHSGHSRTVVGYEINARGDTNLLLFDPGKSVPEHIRKTAIAGLKSRAADRSKPGTPEEAADRGPEWAEKPTKALSSFRVNLGALSKNTEYQVLAFDGGPLLDASERERRKTVTSTVVRG